jgi:hypothetical protein
MLYTCVIDGSDSNLSCVTSYPDKVFVVFLTLEASVGMLPEVGHDPIFQICSCSLFMIITILIFYQVSPRWITLFTFIYACFYRLFQAH